MAEMVNFDVVIKNFFDSVIKWLDARSRKPRDANEAQAIAVAIARLKIMSKDPKKWTEWDTLYEHYGDLNGLCVPGEKWGQYDRRVYIKVTDVLSDMSEYYKKQDDAQKKQKLEESIKNYFVTVSSSLFQKASFKIMSTAKVMQKLSNQK